MSHIDFKHMARVPCMSHSTCGRRVTCMKDVMCARCVTYMRRGTCVKQCQTYERCVAVCCSVLQSNTHMRRNNVKYTRHVTNKRHYVITHIWHRSHVWRTWRVWDVSRAASMSARRHMTCICPTQSIIAVSLLLVEFTELFWWSM